MVSPLHPPVPLPAPPPSLTGEGLPCPSPLSIPLPLPLPGHVALPQKLVHSTAFPQHSRCHRVHVGDNVGHGTHEESKHRRAWGGYSMGGEECIGGVTAEGEAMLAMVPMRNANNDAPGGRGGGGRGNSGSRPQPSHTLPPPAANLTPPSPSPPPPPPPALCTPHLLPYAPPSTS